VALEGKGERMGEGTVEIRVVEGTALGSGVLLGKKGPKFQVSSGGKRRGRNQRGSGC
jgi:hypothetical protein